MEQVLQTSELLEEVLVNLPTRPLLHAQRVNQAWKSLITKSPRIQQSLFFRPAARRDRDTSSATLNPLLANLFPSFFEENMHKSPKHMPAKDAIPNFKWNQRETTKTAVLRADASWRKMLPIQPPAKLRLFERASQRWISERTGNLLSKDSRKVEKLVRMGAIYDYVEQTMADEGASFFCIRWHAIPCQYVEKDEQEVFFRGEDRVSVFGSNDVRDEITVFVRAYYLCTTYDTDAEPPRWKSLGYETPKINWTRWTEWTEWD